MKTIAAGPRHPAYRTPAGRAAALRALGVLVGCEAGAREAQAWSMIDTIAGRSWGDAWIRPDPKAWGMVHEGGAWRRGALGTM